MPFFLLLSLLSLFLLFLSLSLSLLSSSPYLPGGTSTTAATELDRGIFFILRSASVWGAPPGREPPPGVVAPVGEAP